MMSERMRKIVQVIVEGLTLSARATAWREGTSWEPSSRRDASDAGETGQGPL